MTMDIHKVQQRYQVMDMGDNSPLGPTHATRDLAWDWWFEHSEEEMAKPGYGMSTAQRAAMTLEAGTQDDKTSSGDGEGK